MWTTARATALPPLLLLIDDPRVTLLRTTPSGGPSRPRNTGIARARAPYIALLDADDLLKPHKLSAAIAALERHPQAAFAFGDFERIDAQGELLEASTLAGYPMFQSLAAVELQAPWRLIPQAELARGLLYENFIGTSGVVMRKELLDEIGGFDETLVCSEDRDLWFRAAHRGAALYCNEVGHSYRVIPSSLSHGPVIRNARCRIAVLQREKARWTDAAARAQVKQLITENLANIALRVLAVATPLRGGAALSAGVCSFGPAALVARSVRFAVALARPVPPAI